MAETISRTEARRLALAAQGFDARRSRSRSGWPRVEGAIARMGVLQIDSVSAVIRSHYLPAYSRIGPYDRNVLDRRCARSARRALFEYWAHEASLLPLALHPLLRWRMARAARFDGIYGGLARFARERSAYIDSVLDQVRDRGALMARELDEPGKRGGPWWGWNDGKAALEFLFWAGKITVSGRRGFERVYDLPERALPEDALAAPTPPEDEAIRSLVDLAARALGIATEADLRDYFRLPVAETKRAVDTLAEAGDLIPAAVEGWRQTAYRHRDARLPGRVAATALLSPFDPLVWERQRTERLFGFRYRLELYTPAPKREFGYYVLPFLLNGRLAGRVDLKSDRTANTLRVLGAFAEPGEREASVADALAAELRTLADWLELERIAVADGGSLARPLRQAMATR